MSINSDVEGSNTKYCDAAAKVVRGDSLKRSRVHAREYMYTQYTRVLGGSVSEDWANTLGDGMGGQ